MKKIIIPIIKTNCGESCYGDFYFIDNLLHIQLLFEGSQLLEYTCLLFIKIVNNRSIKYLLYAKKIFWRLNKLPIIGNRKEMVEEILNKLIHFISIHYNA
jgi:hypothetical protein